MPLAGAGNRDVKSVEPSLSPGGFLVLKREPQNPHDALAIMILDTGGYHLG